jgi:D-tagatose-1,6-bisphosphate aldolase subunit GatZ/KbaZ
VFEAHSTDYQPRASLRAMVRGHFAVLKVGPALTFAFREMVFALAGVERELFGEAKRAELSNILEVLEAAMLEHPAHWQEHHRGTPEEQAHARRYSLSDRIRYYWADARVQPALDRLMRNLGGGPMPLTLLSQHAPGQAERVRDGIVENSPEALILDRIDQVLQDYAFACRG